MPKLIVTYHPDTYDEFFSDLLADFPTLPQDLMADFLMYKGTGQLPMRFGRDAPYTQPHAAYRAQLMHIHLKLPPDRFPENLPQWDRVCKKQTPHKDAALIYVRGELEEHRYCLFGVLYPDAHARAREEKVMRYLARLAQKFRDEN